jgi:adenine-specific DNA-methyltransferase
MTTTRGVKYIGSKASLVGEILGFVQEHLPAGTPRTLIDVFTGTTRVAQAFRATGWSITTSDLSWASEAYAHAFVTRTAESGRRIPDLITKLKALPSLADWITLNYCDVIAADGGVVKMWKPENGKKADAIRNQIATWETTGVISHHEAMILVACLLFALDKVDSSVGVQQAYLKTWAARASNPLELEDLPFPTGPAGKHIVGNALTNPYEVASVAYLDPPYSAHSYSTYYHIWDSITRWDKPAVGLKTNRRIDRVSSSDAYDESMHSAWNSKRTALDAFMRLIDRLPTRFVVVSYNDESLVPLDTLEAALKGKYTVRIKKIPYKRNIMAQIGNAALGDGVPVTENHEVLIWIEKSVPTPNAPAP